MTLIFDDGGWKGAAGRVWNHYPEVGYRVERGEQVLVLSSRFMGDDNSADIGRFGDLMKEVGRSLRIGRKWNK